MKWMAWCGVAWQVKARQGKACDVEAILTRQTDRQPDKIDEQYAMNERTKGRAGQGRKV